MRPAFLPGAGFAPALQTFDFEKTALKNALKPRHGDDAFTKFGRWVANIALSPGELYTQPMMLSKDQPFGIALFGGVLKGVSMFAYREFVGIYEVLTFPFPIPKGYRPIIEPDTTFTNWGNRAPESLEMPPS